MAQRILVVDDDLTVSDVVRRYLQRSGYEVALAADGPTATAPAGNRLLAGGTFVTHEHDTTGTVQLVRLGYGRRQLVLRGPATLPRAGPAVRGGGVDRRAGPVAVE